MIIQWIRSLQGMAILIGAGLFAGWAWIASIKSGAVQKERARVETVGKKIDAKAQVARRRAVTDADRMLERYYRDR